MIQDFLVDKNFSEVKIDNDYKAGHGHILSIKVVMPTYCQAHCEFCFNKFTMNTQQHNWELFRKNLFTSLNNLFKNLDNRKISIDITGNEPTFNIDHFKLLMQDLAYFKNLYLEKIDKIVLTTNGFHLVEFECIEYMTNVVNIVNISLHKTSYEDRQKLFKTKYIPSNDDLIMINKALKSVNIKSTSVAVFNHDCSFKYIVEQFVNFSRETGFTDTRIRIDFTTEDIKVKKMFDIKFTDNEIIYHQKGLDSKYFDINGFNVSIYRGVPELIDYVLGVELVIDDDGNIYLDYNKNLPISEEDIKSFNNNIYIINE